MRRRSAQLILESQSSNRMSCPAKLEGYPIISAQRSEMNPVPCSRSNSQVPTPVVSTARLIHSALESPPHCSSVSGRLSITSIQAATGYSIRNSIHLLRFFTDRDPAFSRLQEARLQVLPWISSVTSARQSQTT